MQLRLESKVIAITGGAKGIGAAITRACAEEGAIPVAIDRDEQAGRQIEKELTKAGSQGTWIKADLCITDQCRSAVETIFEKYGRIDGLVNNAGVNDRVGLEHGSPKEFSASLQRNLLHFYGMAHFCLPYMKKSRGAIVNISSKVAVTGQGGTSGYASAKGAILALTREWAVELLPYGIRVNAIVPAEVMTPLYQQWLSSFPDPEEKLKTIVSKIPLGQRMTQAEEIAAAVIFLLSEKAGHVTGQHWFVDGGYVHLDRALT
ncbi:MAG TPA: SDR family oxidoreductase [Candidatus Angelobacter sp.]|jgi:NAD(P)-dependent dehydrogenase (short-subunit alcohol dehydrogenase family)|nr:SDR family oxidoreductase [Candidatus Angelobacter sp.]